jgi:flagellar biosynthesis/type III secretory pathway protein FliH
MERLTATAEVLRAERVESLLADYERIGEMKKETERLLATAREAYEIERAKGALEGQRMGAQQAMRLVEEAEQAVRLLVDSLEMEVALLSVVIAERILGTFEERERILRAAQQAIAELREDDSAAITIAPRYVGALRERLAQYVPGVPVSIEADPTMDPGGCSIRTSRGTIDVAIASQVEAVRQAVRGWARNGGGA